MYTQRNERERIIYKNKYKLRGSGWLTFIQSLYLSEERIYKVVRVGIQFL